MTAKHWTFSDSSFSAHFRPTQKTRVWLSRTLSFSGLVFIFVRVFGTDLGVNHTAKVGCFFNIIKIQLSLLLYYSAHKKATAMVFIWGDRGYHAVRFEYKTASERYLVAEIYAKHFWVFLKKLKVSFFSKTPKTVLLISQQLNIAQRPFCIQNERQDILYHLI